MGFASGSVSFRRFMVAGKSPKSVEQSHLDALAEHALRPTEIGMPGEEEYGWCGGRHVLDGTFSFDHNVYADALHFALRVDTNKVPSELKKAWSMMEEDAVAAENPSGIISKNQKKDVKDSVRKKIEDELRAGRFRRSKLLPVLWDVPSQTVYCAAGGKSFEKLAEIFERTFGLELVPMSAGSLGLRVSEDRGKRRDYEDFRPTRFVSGPEGESQQPEYPWVAKGPQPKDFLGNEFMLWLWHEAEARTGVIATETSGDVTIYIDRILDLDCAYGRTGRDTLKGDAPTRMPEARDALRSGKLPRKAGMIIDANRQQYTFSLSAEQFSFGTAKLPDVEDAESPRVVFEERVTLLRDLCAAIDGLFEAFLKLRGSGAWEGHVNGVRRWITQPVKATAAA
jgi:hypothetical protein